MLLKIDNLCAKLKDGKEILKGVNLEIRQGQTHIIMGKNGSGKSTLGQVLAGNPNYQVTKGTVLFDGKDLFSMPVEDRARAGLFLGFQYPIGVAGVSVSHFLRTAKNEKGNTQSIREWIVELSKIRDFVGVDNDFTNRDLNIGFSGGERKKNELLQMCALNPKLAILDEIDSGLDMDSVQIVKKAISAQQKKNNQATILITHYLSVASSVEAEQYHVFADGKIVASGKKELAKEIEKNGLSQYE